MKNETQPKAVSPHRYGGRPCLRGLRIRVKDLLDLLAAGSSREHVLGDYTLLECANITAVLGCEARLPDGRVQRRA